MKKELFQVHDLAENYFDKILIFSVWFRLKKKIMHDVA